MVALRKPDDARHADTRMSRNVPQRDELAAHHLIDEMRLVGGLIERAVYSDRNT